MSSKTPERPPHPGETTFETAERAYNRSRKCFRNDDLDGAFAAIGEVLALDPEYPNAQNFAGWILLHLPMPTPEQLQRAAGHFREAIRISPDDVVPMLNLGEALVALGREGDAIQHIESLLAEGRFKAEALNWLGWYWGFRKGDVERGLDLLQQATQAGPWKATPWVNLGNLQYQRGARSEACFAYRMALSCADVAEKSVKKRVREIEKDMRQRGEEPPIVIRLVTGELAGAELVAIERACSDRRYDDAIAALGRLDANDLVDAIGIAYSGAWKAHAAGQFASARQLLRFVVLGHEILASGAGSGAEGLGRMVDVREMQKLLASWGG